MIYPIAKGHAKDEYLSAFVISRLFPRNDNFSGPEYRDYKPLIIFLPLCALFTVLVIAPALHKVLFTCYNVISGLGVTP